MKGRALLLLAIGFAQMAGNGLHLPWLGHAGFATAASPAPQVFCRLNGTESFACYYSLEWKDKKGSTHSLPLGTGAESRIPGPQARRSMVLATLYGDTGREGSIAWSAKRYAVCGPLLSEMGIQVGDIQWPVFIKVVTPGASLVPEAVLPFGREGCP